MTQKSDGWETPEQIVEKNEAINWILFPWAVRGSIFEFTGDAKLAGKSTLLRAIMRSVAFGEPFLGFHPKMTGSVLYLTEELPAEIRPKLLKEGLIPSKQRIYILPWVNVSGLDWEGLLKKIKKKQEETGAVLVVIDTLAHFALLGDLDENSSKDALSIMRPLHKLAADTDASVLVVRHTRKSGGNAANRGRGSTAMTGAVGGIYSIKRLASSKSKREVGINGRFDGIPETLVIDWDGSGYTFVRSSSDLIVAEPDKYGDLLPLLPASLQSLQDTTGTPRSTLRKALKVLEETGKVTREGLGNRQSPYIYSRCAIDSEKQLDLPFPSEEENQEE